MENPHESTIVIKPVEKKEPEAAVEKRNKPISTFTLRKSARIRHRNDSQHNIFSK